MVNEHEIQVLRAEKLGNGKRRIYFDNGEKLVLYYSETRGLHLEEGSYISHEVYEVLLTEILGKRAKKRALHLLERMDRTEQQLREKLLASEYPHCVVEAALSYVKSFHYIDDQRYANTFIRYKKEKFSRQQMKQKLMQKGVSKELIEDALETAYDADESVHIRNLLEKKNFSADDADESEFRRMYNYLLRRGFRSGDILKEMKGKCRQFS